MAFLFATLFCSRANIITVSLVVLLLSQGLVIKLSTVELFVTHVTNVCTHTNDQPHGTVDNAW